MAKLYGTTINGIIPQSDFSASQNENRGWSATQTFRFKKGEVDNLSVATKFQIGTPVITLDPNVDAFFAYLLLSRIVAVITMDGGWTDITCEFVGFSGATSPNDPSVVPQPTYAKRGTLRSMPISEHPKWKALSDTQKTILGYILSGSYLWDIGDQEVKIIIDDGSLFANDTLTALVTGDAITFADLLTQGQTTYDLGTYEYTHRWEDNEGISAAKMNLLGKIVSSPSGDPPKPGTGRNWILVGANEEQHGSGDFRFTNELQYLLSDEGGHDSFLYSP